MCTGELGSLTTIQYYDMSLTCSHTFVSYVSRNPYSGIGYKNSTDAYLSTKINDMIFAKVNADATFLFHDIFSGEDKDVIKG